MKRGRIQIWQQGFRPEWLMGYFQQKNWTQEALISVVVIPWICTAAALTFVSILLSILLNGSYMLYIQGASSRKDTEQTREHDSAPEQIQWYYSYGNKGKGEFSRLHFLPFPSHPRFLALSHSLLFFLIMLKENAEGLFKDTKHWQRPSGH